MSSLARLSDLLRARDSLDAAISEIIGRPALIGHLGEYIASAIFDIELYKSATHKGSDGTFRTGKLAGRSVNIKWYPKQQGLLDLNENTVPDSYLVLAGPKSQAASSRGDTRPFNICSVFLFDSKALMEKLQGAGVKIGIATSLRKELWASAEIYPRHANPVIDVSEEQRRNLELFCHQ